MTAAKKLSVDADNLFAQFVRVIRRKFRIVGAGPFLVVALSGAILLVGFFYVWTRMQLVQIGYEISSLENENGDLKKRKRELLLEVASLQSPQELEKKAGKIGLVLPAMGKVVHVP
ncbi:MAG: septum formation initiator family protein [Desulfomonilaceae bacterium]